MYIEIISDSPFLFLKPSAMHLHRQTKRFCEKQPFGKHSIDNLMSNLSRKFDLLKKNTNHCVRVITGLKEHGFSNAMFKLAISVDTITYSVLTAIFDDEETRI